MESAEKLEFLLNLLSPAAKRSPFEENSVVTSTKFVALLRNPGTSLSGTQGFLRGFTRHRAIVALLSRR